MERANLYKDQDAAQVLDSIKQCLSENQAIIPISAELHLTKGEPGYSSGHLLRDFLLEDDVYKWLASRTSFDAVLNRYQDAYPELKSTDRPLHYAVRCYDLDGEVAKGENIFMFFPSVLGLESDDICDYFGFEFIDIWSAIFDQIIFPCAKIAFDKESQLMLYKTLRPVLERTIYLASIFHEVGHRCGEWRVSPTKEPGLKISNFHTDVFGELATDMMLCNFLKEFPEVKYFIFLQRMFWFGRFGFKKDRYKGDLNKDNDTWLSAMLWIKYREFGVLEQNQDLSWHIHFDRLDFVFEYILEEIDRLGKEASQLDVGQDELLTHWMQIHVDTKDKQFFYPETMRQIFEKCVHIDERMNRFNYL